MKSKTNENQKVYENSENIERLYDLTKEAPQGSWLNEFLWICAGANRSILRKCPTDFSKFSGIGGTILFTGIMAALSGGYAFFFIFKNSSVYNETSKVFIDPDQTTPIILSIIFGIFWGLLIFNLDRFIVNTMYSDGKHTIGKSEIISGLPRIIIAIFLGIVISTPLELKVFKDRIDSQLVQDNIKRKNVIESENAKEIEKLKAVEKKILNITQQKTNLYNDWQKAEDEANDEAEGGPTGTGKFGKGIVYGDKRNRANNLQEQYKNFDREHQSEYERLEKELLNIKLSIEKIEEQIEKSLSDGFTARYQAYHNLIYGKGNLSLWISSLFITLLFVIIEIAPTFLKMMLSHGPYEDLLNAERHIIKVKSSHIISDINDDINTKLKLSTRLNINKSEAELLANKEILEKIALAQSEIMATAIEKWKEDEMKKIEENPGLYIKSNSMGNTNK